MVGFAFDERSDRAQLILVGAVAIAFIVLGLAVVFNTVLYTENVASTGAADAPRGAETLNGEVEYGAKSLVARTNLDGNWLDNSTARTGTKSNVSKYSTNMTSVEGSAGSVVVSFEALDVTDTDGEDVMGATIQHYGGQFVDADATDPNQNWSVVSSGAPEFGEFNMTVDASSLAPEASDDKFRVVWNASDSNNNYSVWVYRDSSSGNVAIRTFNDSANPATDFGTDADECVLSETSDPGSEVELQFSAGDIVDHPECSGQIDVSAGIPSEETRTLSFHRGESVAGSYTLVVNDPGAVGSDINSPSALSPPILASDSPYWTHAVWEVTLAVTYDSGTVSYEETYQIEVYNRSR